MRVLHVIEATIGGTRRHVVDVVRAQLECGLEVGLVSAALREPAFERDRQALRAAGARCFDLPMQRSIRPGTDLRHLFALQAILEAERPEVVHTHSSKAGVLGRLASMQTGIGARVHTPHTFAFLFRSMFGPLKRGMFRAIESHLGGASAALVAVSSGEAQTMLASGVVPSERVRVVPNGIDPGPFETAEALDLTRIGVPPGAPSACVVGLLNVAKGQDLALCALVEPGLEALHLLLAGHGEDLAALRALADELGVAERVHFLGWRDDAPRLIAACDLVLLPSRWEGMPYVVLEAMAASKPVVATRVDGARELVLPGETGELADVEDAPDLARALRAVLGLSPGERAQLGRAGRERLLAGYTLQTLASGLIAVYDEVA